MSRADGASPWSDIARSFPDEAPSPFRPEQIAPLGVFLLEVDGVDDAVSAETAKVAAQLAPGGEQPHGFQVTDRDRPDRALAVAAMLVAVAQRDLPSLMDLRARLHHVDA